MLVKFKLLELQTWPLADLYQWAKDSHTIWQLHQKYFSDMPLTDCIDGVLAELQSAGALRREAGCVLDAA